MILWRICCYHPLLHRIGTNVVKFQTQISYDDADFQKILFDYSLDIKIMFSEDLRTRVFITQYCLVVNVEFTLIPIYNIYRTGMYTFDK